MNRLLALIFESNTDLFYQILSIPNVATPSELEEESYQEKQKRLSSEGIPDTELAAAINSPLPEKLLVVEINKSEVQPSIEDISAIEPVIYEGSFEEPLRSLVNQLLYDDAFESEITLLLNAAIVHYGIDISEITQVLQTAEKVKGAINLGLEHALKISNRQAMDLYRILGLRGFYRHALSLLDQIRKDARIFEREKQNDMTPEMQIIIQGAMQRFPVLPEWIKNPSLASDEKIEAKFLPFQFVSEYQNILKHLSLSLNSN
jgi:Family of unknown function (DUF6178)